MKVKKGWLAVQVGVEEEDDGNTQRFVIPISYLYHPLFRRLLDKAYDVYGYHTDGPLKLPCSVDDFLHLRWRIEKESNHANHHHHHHHHHNHHHHHLPHALYFHSC
ncbi:auxin-induced protein 6B-like [Senna tora]|uniref:Auxin-induced protein 6B-like n=1 Tax=Senna tora TaxID=362788 RepID=A0A835CIA7_9FABA|nr:auxin-induced protein 6B-like [Senna tora]